MRRLIAAAAMGVLAACFATNARQQPELARLTLPDQFLVDKETDLVAIVKVKGTERFSPDSSSQVVEELEPALGLEPRTS
jgi:hypothetical protein